MSVESVLPRLTAGDALPLVDFALVMMAGHASHYAWSAWIAAADTPIVSWMMLSPLVWLSAMIAPFMLYSGHFNADARAGRCGKLLLDHARRTLGLIVAIGLVSHAGSWVEVAQPGWLVTWFVVIVTLATTSRLGLAWCLRRARGRGHDAASVAALSEGGELRAAAQSAALVGDYLLVRVLVGRPLRGWDAILKTLTDRIVASLACLLLMPLLALIALAIRIDSPGPILFRQRRHGLNGDEFEILKFRTMRCVADQPDGVLRQTSRDDERVTRVGRILRKWSLDELPQLFNVVGGSMSLVGPRPHAVNMRTEGRLGEEITDLYWQRHRVKPGITGWSQVNGARGATETIAQLQRRVELDLHYIEHWSLLFDLKILLLTARAVWRATNAF